MFERSQGSDINAYIKIKFSLPPNFLGLFHHQKMILLH